MFRLLLIAISISDVLSQQRTRTVSLRSHHGKFVVAEPDGRAFANRAALGPWEKFLMTNNGDGTVSFKSHHGRWLVAELDGTLNANRIEKKTWEKFVVTEHGRPDLVSLKSFHGKFVVAEPDGRLDANRADPNIWEQFEVIINEPKGKRIIKLVEPNSSCNSEDVFLGDFTYPEQCADACQSRLGCEFFSFGQPGEEGGRCFWEKAGKKTCPAGFKAGSFDFYRVGNLEDITNDMILSTIAVGKTCSSGDSSMGTTENARQCADKCLQKFECEYFTFNKKTNACTQEKTESGSKACEEGLQDASQDVTFYRVLTDSIKGVACPIIAAMLKNGDLKTKNGFLTRADTMRQFALFGISPCVAHGATIGNFCEVVDPVNQKFENCDKKIDPFNLNVVPPGQKRKKVKGHAKEHFRSTGVMETTSAKLRGAAMGFAERRCLKGTDSWTFETMRCFIDSWDADPDCKDLTDGRVPSNDKTVPTGGSAFLCDKPCDNSKTNPRCGTVDFHFSILNLFCEMQNDDGKLHKNEWRDLWINQKYPKHFAQQKQKNFCFNVFDGRAFAKGEKIPLNKHAFGIAFLTKNPEFSDFGEKLPPFVEKEL